MEDIKKTIQSTEEQNVSENPVELNKEKELKNTINKTYLTDENIGDIIESVKENIPDEVKNMRESISDTSDIEAEGGEDGYVEEIRNIGLNSSYADLLGEDAADQINTMDGSIFDITSPTFKPDDNAVKAKMLENTDIFNLTEEESIEFVDLIMRYHNKEDIKNIYSKMPSKVRRGISNLASQQGLPPSELDTVAKLFIDEFISNAELDEVFIDLEKSLDEALKIPSIADMYSEHTRTVMEEKIPEIIEKIQDKEPENAEMLRNIQNGFKKSYSLSHLKDFYKVDHRTRSDMRDHADNPFSYCELLNLDIAKSKFKMPDCLAICPALSKVLIKDPEGSTVEEGSRVDKMNITTEDVSKFIILLCRSFKFYDFNNVVESAEVYYSIKNIIMLGRASEAKTNFSAELINNICDIIEFIREQGAIYEARMHKRSNKRRRSK